MWYPCNFNFNVTHFYSICYIQNWYSWSPSILFKRRVPFSLAVPSMPTSNSFDSLRNEQEQVWTNISAHARLHLQKHTSAVENLCGHLGRFPINFRWKNPRQQKQSSATSLTSPLFNMLLGLPSSIKTNDLSSVRHRGAKLSSCFPERRDVMDFHMRTLFEMLMKKGKQTRGEHQ